MFFQLQHVLRRSVLRLAAFEYNPVGFRHVGFVGQRQIESRPRLRGDRPIHVDSVAVALHIDGSGDVDLAVELVVGPGFRVDGHDVGGNQTCGVCDVRGVADVGLCFERGFVPFAVGERREGQAHGSAVDVDVERRCTVCDVGDADGRREVAYRQCAVHLRHALASAEFEVEGRGAFHRTDDVGGQERVRRCERNAVDVHRSGVAVGVGAVEAAHESFAVGRIDERQARPFGGEVPCAVQAQPRCRITVHAQAVHHDVGDEYRVFHAGNERGRTVERTPYGTFGQSGYAVERPDAEFVERQPQRVVLAAGERAVHMQLLCAACYQKVVYRYPFRRIFYQVRGDVPALFARHDMGRGLEEKADAQFLVLFRSGEERLYVEYGIQVRRTVADVGIDLYSVVCHTGGDVVGRHGKPRQVKVFGGEPQGDCSGVRCVVSREAEFRYEEVGVFDVIAVGRHGESFGHRIEFGIHLRAFGDAEARQKDSGDVVGCLDVEVQFRPAVGTLEGDGYRVSLPVGAYSGRRRCSGGGPY